MKRKWMLYLNVLNDRSPMKWCIPAIYVCIILLNTMTLGQPMNSDWPMFNHDPQHTGSSPYVGPDEPVLLWAHHIGTWLQSSSAMDQDGNLYFGSAGYKSVFALSSAGERLWQFQTRLWVQSSPAIGQDGTIYVGSWDSTLYAIHPDGSLKWEYRTGSHVAKAPNIASDGTIYVGSGDMHLHAVNPDGSPEWTYLTEGDVGSSPAIDQDGTIYFGSYDGKLYALYPYGKLKWATPLGAPVPSSPVVDLSGTIYVGCDNDKLYALNRDGTIKWSFQTAGNISACPSLDDAGNIYFGSHDKFVYSVTPSGSLRWKYETGDLIWDGSPTIDAAGNVYIGSHDNAMYALNPDGTLKWKFMTNGDIGVSAVLDKYGRVYFGSKDGNFYALGDKSDQICGDEVERSPYPLHMPFEPGTTWRAGGVGNYYGEGAHADAENSYYSIDWTIVGGEDLGQPVYPVTPGMVADVGFDDDGYGNYVDVVHSFHEPPYELGVIKTRYAQLDEVLVSAGDPVFIDTQIATVGTSGDASFAHLHLSFQIYDGAEFVSLEGTEPSRRPAPMVARAADQLTLWEVCKGESRTVASKQFFDDVPNDFWAKAWIDAAYAWGVMGPYPQGQTQFFAPDVPLNRAYLAVIWGKAYHGVDYTPPPASGTIFDDVPADYWAADWIEQAYHDGFTQGCSEDPPLYCPEEDVKRAELAVFVLRALYGSDYVPPDPSGDVFDDAPADYWGTKWIEQLAAENMTAGCSLQPPLFCPENPVTRAEMSVFVLRAFGIYPPVVGGYAGPPEESRTWEAQITIEDAQEGHGALIFGQSVSATEALDEAFNEEELPPLPPTGSFDVRFELLSAPGVGTLRDFRPAQQNETTWKLKFQPGPGGYPITISWNKAELPLGNFYLKDEITGTIVNVDMKQQEDVTISNTAISSLLIVHSSLLARTVNVAGGWNIVSVPVQAEQMQVGSLFPSARSAAFYFEEGYVSTDDLLGGMGYWLKFDQPINVSISGSKVLNRDIEVKAGWNIIGPYETDVFTSDITTTPEDLIQTSFYGFDNGYLPSTILRVGQGYWIKVNQDGMMSIPEGGSFAKGSNRPMTSSDILQKLQSWPRLVFRDASGHEAVLYLMPHDAREPESRFELPPLPPTGLWDVRFESDQFVERAENTLFPFKLSGEQYPVTITAEQLGSLQLQLKSQNNSWAEALIEGKNLKLDHNSGPLALSVTDLSLVPSSYELSQNYPNPFNPSTTIKFSLPEATHVSLTIYNALGAQVEQLLDGRMTAGYHQLEINAAAYASGLYFYALETPAFQDVKKMIVLK